jgi:hypothetical protein
VAGWAASKDRQVESLTQHSIIPDSCGNEIRRGVIKQDNEVIDATPDLNAVYTLVEDKIPG